jgi:NitT/TauT family transport system substrate-binding protein
MEPDTAPRAELLPVRFILNTFYSGPQAWFFLAADNGHFRDEGLDVQFTEGSSLARAVMSMTTGDFDVGYGDLNELVRMKAEGQRETPLAVMAIHNRPPYTIAVPASGPVINASGLAGKRLVSHPQDAALLLFPEFCRATGLEPDSVNITISELTHVELSKQMMEGAWDGIFGFVNTINSQAIEAGIDPSTSLRHLTWHEHIPALYGGAVLVAPSFLNMHPKAVGGLVRAINRGLMDTIKDIDAAIDAVGRRNSGIDRKANRERLLGTLALEMGHPEAVASGLGDVNDARLKEIAKLIVETKGYSGEPPEPHLIFRRDFLPPSQDRARVKA